MLWDCRGEPPGPQGDAARRAIETDACRARAARGRPTGDAPMESYERLKQIVAEIEDDIQKAKGGNKAAGTRVRGAMQDVKKVAQEIRQQILELRDAGSAG